MISYRKITAATAFLVFGVLAMQESSAQDPDISKVKIPTVESRGGVYYLVLDGETPYARALAAPRCPPLAACRVRMSWR